jgi:hypothetical protein
MKYSIAIASFLVSFVITALAVSAVGWLVSVVILIYGGKTDYLIVPRLSWLIIWLVAAPVAVIAGIYSFRATLKHYQSK